MIIHSLRVAVVLALSTAAFLAFAEPAHATAPGRNGLIAFTAGTDGGPQLFTVRANGSGLRQITHVDGEASNVDWAPNGRNITFVIATDGAARIATARPDGSHLRVLPQPTGVFDDQPSYSPDGRTIYFERFTVANNDDAIWRMTADGSHQRRILAPFQGGSVTDPNVSPDGKTLSFQATDGSVTGPPPALEAARGLFTSGLDGDHVKQIRPFTADETIKADWAPNGRRIAVTENANHFRPQEAANIVTVRPDGSCIRVVTRYDTEQTNAYLGSYSPDGRWLVFRYEVNGLFGLYRVRPDGSQRREILAPTAFRPSLIDWGARPSSR
jgi:Tol biopolymer transport system component